MNVATTNRDAIQSCYAGADARGGVVRTLLLILLLGASLVATPAFAQVEFSEYEVKAAFIYQFLSYVTWPASKDSEGPLLVGVVGAPQLVANLSTLAASQTANGRAIEVRVLTPDSDPRSLHAIFVAAAFDRQSRDLLRTAVGNAVLTITERRPRAANSVINFEVVDNKVRFDVALGLARRNELDISARLLQVALRVVDEP